jgi:hypothetical protein
VKKIVGRKRAEVTGGWREPYNDVVRDLYSSLSAIRMMKSSRMRLVVHVAQMGEKRNAYSLLVGKPEGWRPLGNQDVGGWIMLKWILES